MSRSVSPPIHPASGLEPSRYVTVAQAAKLLGVSPSTVWRWIDGRKLPAYRVGPRGIRIREEDLQAAIRPARERNEASVQEERISSVPPSPQELARRQALVATILKNREERRIAPLTSADLVRRAREEAGMADGRDR
jgi:excisionase family DNA binding protein